MDVGMFDFELPRRCIAQEPLKDRHTSKMMVINREINEISHKKFYDVLEYLNKGDVLVLNNTRVFKARIRGVSIETNGKMEFLLIRRVVDNVWEVMCKPGKRASIGKKFSFGCGQLIAKVVEIIDGGRRFVEFCYQGDFYEILNSIGEMPIPPYINEGLGNSESYQTVYSDVIGSVATPTAGLHFTNELLSKIKNIGVSVVYITLHVGLGTFIPIKSSNLEDHVMHSEYYDISERTAKLINLSKSNGGRIIAVGTTTVRTLESVATSDSSGNVLVRASSGYTDIFIKPGYKFKIVDSIITNFHLPKSTLIVLVSAFYDRKKILSAYEEAVLNDYRFFSFGDSMLII